MKLSELRPKSGADLEALSAAIKGKPWDKIKPSALPDDTLLRVAKDFRIVETISTRDEHAPDPPGAQAAVTIALLLVTATLIGRAEVLTGRGDVNFPDDALPVLMRAYLGAVERVTISRILGEDEAGHDQELAQVFDAVVANRRH